MSNFSLNGQKKGILMEYSGGPGSILGVGQTIIKFADQRTGKDNPELKNFFADGGGTSYGVFISPKPKINFVNVTPSTSSRYSVGASSIYGNRTKEAVNNEIDYSLNQRTDFIDSVYQLGNFKPTKNPKKMVL